MLDLVYVFEAIALEFKVTEVSLEQLEKAYSPMLVTLLPMVMEVRPQDPKAPSPMLVTLLGMVMEVRPEQPSKA